MQEPQPPQWQTAICTQCNTTLTSMPLPSADCRMLTSHAPSRHKCQLKSRLQPAAHQVTNLKRHDSRCSSCGEDAEAPMRCKEDCPKIANLYASSLVSTCSGHTTFQACIPLSSTSKFALRCSPNREANPAKLQAKSIHLRYPTAKACSPTDKEPSQFFGSVASGQSLRL